MSATQGERFMHEIEVRQDLRIPTADPAVTLGADVYLPADAGPSPLLLMALPYRKDQGGSDLLHRYFARRGYASMILDLRGTGSSDGDPREPFAVGDVQDVLDAIAWGAEQDWCDGSVGMWGHSYGAMLTMRTAARRPPGLKAIVPVQGFLDPEVDFVHPNHARGCFGPATWISGMVGNLVLPPLQSPEDEHALARWRARLDRADTHVLDLYRHAPGDPAWRDRTIDASAIDVPALCWLGWRDLFADAQARAFEAMAGPKRLIAGPWMHVLPVVSDEGPLDFLGICLSWWDRWLKGVDNGADSEPSAYYVQGPSPYWTALEAWPPRRCATASLDPRDGSPDIRLSLTAAAGSSDPTVGLLSGLTRLPSAGLGLPADQHDDDLRSTCWTSEPLEQRLAVVGRPEVVLDAAAPGRLVAKLTHVDPAGRSILVTSGARGEGVAGAIDRLVLDATAYEIPAGHRLRLVLSEADFPRLWPREKGAPPAACPRSITLPTLLPEEVRDVTLPDQPAHLAALAETLQAGGNGSWSVEREVVTGTVTMTMTSASATAPPGAAPQVTSSTRSVAVASHTAPPAVRTSNDWEVHWPSHPVIGVHVETAVTNDGFVASARLTTGGDVTFEKTWTTSWNGDFDA